jgi:NADH-quinone oxidoreductase subunit H
LANALIFGGLIATFFWGGWWLYGLDNIIPSWLIFLVKMLIGYWIFVWARGTLPRLRIDQLLQFSWKFLIPLSLVFAVIVAAEVGVWQEADLSSWVAVPAIIVVNALAAIVLVVGVVRLLGLRRIQEPRRALLTNDIGIIHRAMPRPAASAPFDVREPELTYQE